VERNQNNADQGIRPLDPVFVTVWLSKKQILCNEQGQVQLRNAYRKEREIWLERLQLRVLEIAEASNR